MRCFASRLRTYSFNSSPEASSLSIDQSLLECNTILEMSDTDSETEPSLSEEVSSHQKGLAAESLWAGHAVQANRSLAAVLTVEQSLVVNVTDGLLSTLQDLVDGEELSAADSELINNLGGEGSIVYTEIKVMQHNLFFLEEPPSTSRFAQTDSGTSVSGMSSPRSLYSSGGWSCVHTH